MTTALPKPAQAPDPDIEALIALVYVVLSRLAQVEETVALLAERAGVIAPPVDAAEKVTVKRAAHELGCSAPNVYRLVRLRVLTAEKRGGRVLVSVNSINKQRERTAVRS